MPIVLTLDAGTGGAKCVAVDETGAIRGEAVRRWSYQVESNAEVPIVKEYSFDPEEFWKVLGECSREALRDLPANDVTGVVATSQREGCVFLDDRGREMYAGPNLDSRGFMEGLEVLDKLGATRLYEITGHSAPFIFPIARYMWFRRNDRRPIARLLMINDWIGYRCCGAEVGEPSNASESMLYDFRRRDWSQEILDLFEIDAASLPAIGEPGQIVGEITPDSAEHLGVAAGTPFHLGGADTQCGLLGIGACEAGDIGVTLGTTSPVQAVVGEPVLDPAENLWAGCHVVPSRWVIESNCGSTGDAFEWLLDLTRLSTEDRYGAAEAAARDSVSAGAYAFTGPRVFDINKLRHDLPGAILFPFPSMQLRPDAGQILRSFLESVAFAVRANLEQLEIATGRSCDSLAAGGGMSRSDLLIELVATATGRPVQRADRPQSTALGCSALVFGATGVYANAFDAARAMCRNSPVEPVADERTSLDDRYAKWRELYDGLESMSI